jgi:hypothetical protein
MRKLLLTVASVAVFGGLACQDTSMSPSARAPELKGSSALLSLGNETLTKQFTINPAASTTIDIHGLFAVKFPAASVCNPDVTASCVPATSPISVTATVRQMNGRMWVEFQPHLTFVNTTNRSKWVVLSTSVFAQSIQANRTALAANRKVLRKYELLYSPSVGALGIDESRILGDASLRTRINLASGIIWRRIFHFSTYHIVLQEFGCEISPDDPFCVEYEGDQDPPDEDPPGDGDM